MKYGLKSDFLDYYDHHFRARLLADRWYERFASRSLFRWCVFHILRKFSIPTPPHGPVENFPDILENYPCNPTEKFTETCKNIKLVIYEDPFAHRGEGKKLVSLEEALKKYRGFYASLYIPPSYGKYPVSIRALVIGRGYLASIVYWNEDHSKWRSNYGSEVKVSPLYLIDRTDGEKIRIHSWPGDDIKSNMEINTVSTQFSVHFFKEKLEKKLSQLQKYLRAPLLAIDFVYAGWNPLIASPLNGYLAVDLNTAPQLKGTGI